LDKRVGGMFIHVCLYSQFQSITAPWLVLIFHPVQSRRLSWLEWLVTSRGGLCACSADGDPSQY